MSTVDGLPGHILLNHLVVVLGPLAAILAILCALWASARQRLVWLTLALTVVTLIVTPLTASTGDWLFGKLGSPPAVENHAKLGATMVYIVAALAVAVTMLAVIHLRLARGRTVKTTARAVVTVLVIASAVATLVQTYRVGETGARAAWGSVTASAPRHGEPVVAVPSTRTSAR